MASDKVTSEAVDLVDVGIQLAESSIEERAKEDRSSIPDASRALLSEGLDGWTWPSGLTSAEIDVVRREALQQLRNRSREVSRG